MAAKSKGGAQLRIPNAGKLAQGTLLDVYGVGGVDTALFDKTGVEEGLMAKIGTAVVSADGKTIETQGDGLPFLTWVVFKLAATQPAKHSDPGGTMSTFSRRLLALGLLLFLPAGAWAEDVLKLEIVSAVVEGLNKPGLRLRANTDLDRITVILHRSDGRDFRLEKGPVKNRETVVFDFPQEAGTQHYQGRLVVKNGEEDGEMPLSFDLQVLPGLKLTLLPEKFDRAAKSLALVASRPLTRVEWTVIGDTGEVIGKGTDPLRRESGRHHPLTVEWSDAKGTPIRIDLKGYDASNTFALLELSPLVDRGGARRSTLPQRLGGNPERGNAQAGCHLRQADGRRGPFRQARQDQPLRRGLHRYGRCARSQPHDLSLRRARFHRGILPQKRLCPFRSKSRASARMS